MKANKPSLRTVRPSTRRDSIEVCHVKTCRWGQSGLTNIEMPRRQRMVGYVANSVLPGSTATAAKTRSY